MKQLPNKVPAKPGLPQLSPKALPLPTAVDAPWWTSGGLEVDKAINNTAIGAGYVAVGAAGTAVVAVAAPYLTIKTVIVSTVSLVKSL